MGEALSGKFNMNAYCMFGFSALHDPICFTAYEI